MSDLYEQHRLRMAEFMRMRDADPQAALAYAKSAVEQAKRLDRDDPQRGDALELLAMAHLHLEEYEQALAPVTEAVRIRKVTRPVPYELLLLVLSVRGTVLFALERSAEADEMLREHLAACRKAFDARDLRLAQKLEQYAQYVQKGFQRRRWVIELLKEAVAIRVANPGGPAGKLAETLHELALQQMLQSEYSAADANLVRAEALLRAETARDPAREETKAGLAQILVMRAGLAALLAEKAQAMAYAHAAGEITFADKVLQAENEILVAAALSKILEITGALDGAITEQKKVLEVFRRNQDLVADGALDAGGIGDALWWLGSLYLACNDLERARAAIDGARGILGDSTAVLFQLAELERKSGNEVESLQRYQEALRTRKENASEAVVMFGTNRVLEPADESARFGGDSGEHLSVGRAVVLVPGAQFSDEAWLKSSRPSPIPVGMATDPTGLFIRTKSVLSAAEFQAHVRTLVDNARLYPKSALVFVHGYNVTFDAALRRGGQLARDLNYDSALFVFSWPSKGNFLRYGTDRVSADQAARSLVAFLGRVEAATGAEHIHIVAHSMGNRVLLPALVRVAGDAKSKVRPKLAEVIFAAPAVPQKEFSDALAELSRHGLRRFTLYASAIDKAMMAGYIREWGTVLAGYVAHGEPLMHESVQSIDVSEAGIADLVNLNHDVFASNPVITEDMRQLLQQGQRPPEKRIPTLQKRPAVSQPGDYWYYRAAAD